ncbi:MAG: hypothetical protein A3J38_07655 [Gammaproteobacteria bacterium RIFCSPHIGHO2_12_FULL_45_9]|nr:MAG: hypothetical protein A3J38_07655 [Gammaproteobacteria bacterium RIFCSPHIGHO2_12_FULL_45_9]
MARKKQVPLNPEVKDHLQRVLEFLKKQHVFPLRFGKHHNTPPWILLLGPSGSGKTTLLAHAGLALKSPTQHAIQPVRPTVRLDWWVSSDAVFIDPAGELALAQGTEEAHHRYFRPLLEQLVRFRKNVPLSGVMIVVDFSRLVQVDTPDWKDWVTRINYQLQTLLEFNSQLTVIVLVTHIDQLQGFQEFFADIDGEERDQPFGFSLLSDKENASWAEIFADRFQEFLQQMSRRTLFRLHHEQNIVRRSRISDFPFHLERLGEFLEKWMHQLPRDPRLHIRGLYFTSSVQGNMPLNLLEHPLERQFMNNRRRVPVVTTKDQPFFLCGLLKQYATALRYAEMSLIPHRNLLWYAAPISLLLLAIATVTFHQAYLENRHTVAIVEANLEGLSTSDTWLTQLKVLQATEKALVKQQTFQGRAVGLDEGVRLQKKLQSTYDTILRKNFVPFLTQSLNSQIANSIHDNPPALYAALETYLLLHQDARKNQDLIIHWFSHYFQQQFSGNVGLQKELLAYLTTVLAFPNLEWPIDADLIKNAQATLQKRPLPEIAFLMLQSQYSQKPVPITSLLTSIPQVDTKGAQVPQFYTQDTYTRISEKAIPELATEVSKGNWIIGQTAHPNPLTATDRETLSHNLRAMYIQGYAAAWASAIAQIRFQPPTDSASLLSEIQLLDNLNSPLWQLIKKTTHFQDVVANAADMQDVVVVLTQHFSGLFTFLQQNAAYNTLHEALQHLQAYVSKIQYSPSPLKVSYDDVVRLFEAHDKIEDPIAALLQVADTLPSPAKELAKNLAQNTIALLMTEAQQYLNTIWQASVVPEYHERIANHYPIFRDASDNISLADFNRFFGPGGTIESFFNYYLKPFVNTENVYWTWRSLDGVPVNISQSVLDMIIRASMIQKMFYTDNTKMPTLKFTLTPLRLPNRSEQLILNLGGQIVRYDASAKNAAQFMWPGPDGDFVTLRFEGANDLPPTITKTGTWGWLRLLDTARIQPTIDPRVFEVTLNVDNLEIVYQLTADNPVNPYTSGLLSAFRCPDSL